MRSHVEYLNDEPVNIHVMTDINEDAGEFLYWLDDNQDQWIAIDVEATGLNQRANDWEIKTVQFGTRDTAWVIPAEHRNMIQAGLKFCVSPLAHNRVYDATALEVSGYAHSLWQGRDTMIMAHLLDSRSLRDGGVGHGLKALATYYVDANAADSDAALKQWAKDNKVKMGDRFAAAPLEAIEVYAGMDVILTRHLFDVLEFELKKQGDTLQMDELNIQRACTVMANRGMRLDVDYAHALGDFFEARASVLKARMADEHSIENPNSTKQIRERLEQDGEVLYMRTASGQASVAKEVLVHLEHPLAKLLTEYRHVSKFKVSYVDRCLGLESNGRVHPNIRSLQARTARMAISDPPLQQLPATDALVRRMFIADPGMVMGAADFSQVELRVLAALADETAMLEAIADGVDLHTNTAERVGIDRKIAKMTNFLTVYGGGKRALAVQADISEVEASAALQGFKRAFPKITTYGNRLQERSGYGKRPVVTPSGRNLRLDRDRTYAAINYVVQSAARDVLANAIIEVEASKYGSGMLLPVHDEIIFQVPEENAQADAEAIARLMEMDFLGVFISSDAEIFGDSWGHGYLGMEPLPPELESWF